MNPAVQFIPMDEAPLQPPPVNHDRIPVTPRVRAGQDAEPLPLAYRIQQLLNQNSRAFVNLCGERGSGKTTALQLLSRLFPNQLNLLDTNDDREVPFYSEQPTLFTTLQPSRKATITFELEPWNHDDIIEYLLNNHRPLCHSVMQRLTGDSGLERLAGIPELTTQVIELFCRNPSLTRIADALRLLVQNALDSPSSSVAAHKRCLDNALGRLSSGRGHIDWPRILTYPITQLALASAQLASEISAGNLASLQLKIPHDLLRETAACLGADKTLPETLTLTLHKPTTHQAMLVSLLLMLDPHWHPRDLHLSDLANVRAVDAQWPLAPLARCNLDCADLRGALLAEANLQSAILLGANLRKADLRTSFLKNVEATGANFWSANLQSAYAEGANFTEAIFENACLNDADFRRTQLSDAKLTNVSCLNAIFHSAVFSRTEVTGANFSGADFFDARFIDVKLASAILHNARFRQAHLQRCDLEGLDFGNADFTGADLSRSYLTASTMRLAKLTGASLRYAGLAHIDWEGCDLRNADFHNASFHLGSSRSGLVHSTIASEGSRTGFYTDDYNEQDFKSPEEIRKANLSYCDLRGANIESTDFYLVDLRGAIYTPDQALHFEKCGAILKSRVK